MAGIGLASTNLRVTKRDSKKFLGGAAKGAAAGSLFGLPGTILGGIGGGIMGMLEDDPEEELRRRKDEMIAKINNERAKRIGAITRESANARQSSAQSAMARAIDTGRDPSDIEDSLLVANQQNVQASNQAINQADQYFTDQALAVEGEYASRPLETPLSETLFDAGTMALQGYYQQKGAERQDKYIDAYTKNLGLQNDVLTKSLNKGVAIGTTGTTGNTSGVLSNDVTPITVPPPQFSGIVDNKSVANSFDLSRYAKTSGMAKMKPKGLMSYKGVS